MKISKIFPSHDVDCLQHPVQWARFLRILK